MHDNDIQSKGPKAGSCLIVIERLRVLSLGKYRYFFHFSVDDPLRLFYGEAYRKNKDGNYQVFDDHDFDRRDQFDPC